ncbi:MAG TPA: ComEC/Rec2 family competence protein [Pyrinomonadaceae bacterium]|nr:ComEC/Rec2 family competence protein [Pyrinomonadaceae bacterium]
MTNSSSPMNFARYPLLLLAAAFAVGAVISKFTETPSVISGGIVVVCCAIGLVNPRTAVITLALAFVSLGAFCYRIERVNIQPDRLKLVYDENRITSGQPVDVDGTIVSGPEPTGSGFVMTVDARSLTYQETTATASGRARIYVLIRDDAESVEFEKLDLDYGTEVRIACELRREESFQNPGVMPQLEMYDQQGIDTACTVKDPFPIENLGHSVTSVPLRWIFDQRRRLIGGFRTLLEAPAAGVMTASLLGDKYLVDRRTADVFRDGGTFHILVISGLHITFIGWLTLLVVGLFTKRKIWRFLIATGFLWAYTLAVGAEVPVVRASLMFTILLISQVVHRNGTLLNSLGFCALLLLVWQPQDLFTASFQLTFVSVASIVGVAFPLIEKLRAIGSWTPNTMAPFPPNVDKRLRRFCEMFYWHDDAWKIESKQHIWTARIFKSPYLEWLHARGLSGLAAYLFEGLLVSAIVQICLLPFLVYYFHRVSFASIFLNLWVGVVLAVETFFAIAAVIVSNISVTLAMPFAAAAEMFNGLLVSLPRYFMHFGSFSSRIPVYPGVGKIVYLMYGMLVAAVAILVFQWEPLRLKDFSITWKRSIFTLAVAALVFGSLVVFHPFSSPRPDGRLKVEFLDVGQGDSAFVTFPNGKTMLIDGGGRFSFLGDSNGDFEADIPRIGERVVSEFLWEKGYSSVNYVVATHADADHIQGLVDAIRNFKVGEVYVGRIPSNDPEFDELKQAIEFENVPTQIVGRGDSMTIGNAKVNFLYPEFDPSQTSPSDNDHSVVLQIAYGSRTFLFSGDVERAAEIDLLRDTDSLRADVVKVPHHGSKTSSSQGLVDAANAKYAVISVGRRSIFGHPHTEVVERWKGSGANVMTTGEKGTVTISTNGEDLNVSTYK